MALRPFGEDLAEGVDADGNDLVFENDFGAGDFQTFWKAFLLCFFSSFFNL